MRLILEEERVALQHAKRVYALAPLALELHVEVAPRDGLLLAVLCAVSGIILATVSHIGDLLLKRLCGDALLARPREIDKALRQVTARHNIALTAIDAAHG